MFVCVRGKCQNAVTAGHPVTLSQLLSHTAGMPEAGLQAYPEGRPVRSLLQARDGLPPAATAPVRVVHSPGERYRYSSAGYAVVQQLMEDATGLSFAAAVSAWCSNRSPTSFARARRVAMT